MGQIVNKLITISEYNGDIDTNIRLKNGDWVDISASGAIWAGLWFTGPNGPEGMVDHSATPGFPQTGVAPYCLLGKTAEDDYFYIGKGLRRTYLNESLGPGETDLYLRINDNVPGNGNGAFSVHIQVWRN